MNDELIESPRPAPPLWWRRAPGCVAVVLVILAVIAFCSFERYFARTWPPAILRPSAHHYSILAAPDDMLAPRANGPSLVHVNQAGQTLIYSGNRSMLWTPPGIDSADSQLVDFTALLHAGSDFATVLASALNSYGQVAGVMEDHSRVNDTRDTVFLWTPDHPHGSVGALTTLAPPPPRKTAGSSWYGYVWGLNDYGQVTFDWGDEGMLWIPDTPNGLHGTAQSIQPDNHGVRVSLRGPNATGQVMGLSGRRPFLWTPTHPHSQSGTAIWLDEAMESIDNLNDFGQVVGHGSPADTALLWTPAHANSASGQLTRIPKPSRSDEIHLRTLSATGALAGVAINVSQTAGELNDALVWLPDAPNSPTGRLQTLGALGWNEDGSAWDINTTGTVLGDSCFLERQVTDVGCQQTRYFIWDQRAGMHDLQTLLDSGSGYTLTDVWALNDQGQIVAIGESAAETYRLLLLTPH